MNVRDRTYRRLRNSLLLGQVQPGARLSDSALAQEIGVSRTPVREAISRLQSDGFVDNAPRKGALVRRMGRQETMDAYELRESLEGFAAHRAAKLMRPAEIEELALLCDRMRQLARMVREDSELAEMSDFNQRLVVADVAFHLHIVRSLGNSRMTKIVSDAHIVTNLVGHNRINPGSSILSNLSCTWRDHYRIYRAIKRGQSDEARHWMVRHMHTASRGAKNALDHAQKHSTLLGERSAWSDELIDLANRLERDG